MYLNLLFFFGILCQVIFATLSDNDARVSSDFLVRKRRVINHLPSGRGATRIEHVNYIIKIREENRFICTGVILSPTTVITVLSCVTFNVSYYKILSGAGYDHRSKFHDVTSKVIFYGKFPHQSSDGIALLTVHPPFQFSSKTASIQLHSGPLPLGTNVTVFGWGYSYPIQPGPEMRQKLGRITLPLMNHGECQTAYHGRFNITEKHICTHDPQQYCAHGDAGAPLVVNKMLVGIHVWKGECSNSRNPDIFINLQRPEYSEWIREHIR